MYYYLVETKERKAMGDLIRKKLIAARVYRVCFLVLSVFAAGVCIASAFVENNDGLFALMFILFTALWICALIYVETVMPFTSAEKWLREKGMEHVADDIVLDSPMLPRSKVYCGQKAIFFKKPCVIIPYEEFAWVYLYQSSAYGIITVDKAVIVYTTDGKKITLRPNYDEFKWLLDNYIIPNSPNIVLGYNAEQRERYRRLNPRYVEAGKRTKRIWGIVLMCIGAVLLAALLLNIKNADILTAGVMILVAFGIGAILYILGKKK